VTDQFIAKSDGNVNNNMRFQLVGMTAGRWMTFQLNFSAACIVGVVAMSITLNHETVDPGTTGLALTYAMLCTRTLGMIIRFFTDLVSSSPWSPFIFELPRSFTGLLPLLVCCTGAANELDRAREILH
jgi:hypothetical protein